MAEISGTITSAPAATTPVISVQTAAAGGYSVALSHLEVQGTTRLAGGRIILKKADISAKAQLSADLSTATVTDFDLTGLELGAVDWRTEDGGHVSSCGPITVARIHGVPQAKAGQKPIATVQEPGKGGASPPAVATVSTAAIDIQRLDLVGIDAADLQYAGSGVNISLGSKEPHRGALHVQRVTLSRFHVPLGDDKDLSTTGHIEGVGAHAEARFKQLSPTGKALKDGLQASGGLDVGWLSVDLKEGGHLTTRATGVSGDVDVSGEIAGFPIKNGHIALSDTDTGVVDIGPEEITIGGKGHAGLSIGKLTISSLNIAGDKAAAPLWAVDTGKGNVTLSGITVSGRLLRSSPGGTKKGAAAEKAPMIRQILIDSFDIAEVSAQGVTVSLNVGGYMVQVVVGAGAPATLHHVGLQGNGTGPFVITPGAEHSLQGAITAKDFAAPLHAEAGKKLLGDFGKADATVQTGAISVGFMDSGSVVVDLNYPTLSSLRGSIAVAGTKVTLKELGATQLHYEDGKLTAKGAHADNIVVDLPGIHIEIPKVDLGDVNLANLGSKTAPAELSAPLVQVEGASLTVDFTKISSGGGSAGPSPSVTGWEQLLDSLNGGLAFKLRVGIHLDNWLPSVLDQLDTDLAADVDLHFSDGKIDYKKLQEQVNRASGTGGTWTGRRAAGFAASSFEFWTDDDKPSDLVVGLHIYDVQPPSEAMEADPTLEPTPIRYELARWHLETGEVTESKDKHLLRMRRAAEKPGSVLGPDLSQGVLAPSPGGSAPNPSWSWFATFALQTLEFDAIVANLDVKNTTPVTLTIGSPPSATPGAPTPAPAGSVSGTVTFGKEAIVNLQLKGGVASPVRPTGRPGAPDGFHAVSLDQLNLDNVDLMVAGASVTTGTIEVRNLKDADLRLDKRSPQTLRATIEKVIVHGLHVK